MQCPGKELYSVEFVEKRIRYGLNVSSSIFSEGYQHRVQLGLSEVVMHRVCFF